MRTFTLCLSVIFLSLLFAHSHAIADDRPNILWITAEDMSPTLGCYGDTFATTPNIDALASESVRYTHAFATSPVCSPSRSCLINGCIATTQGTHNMRSQFPIPKSMLGFPALLREAGYYTTNNSKTDYNSGYETEIIRASWNESSENAHWRSREEREPFFSVFNLMTSHQSRSMVWSYEQFQSEVQSQLSGNEIHDPSLVPLPPYYPDTPLIRKTLARYYDCVTAMDKEVGQILAQLEEDGLADETIVFFYSDHGSGMPRHKRALLDSGMQVAMLIRFPAKYAHLAPGKPGSSTNRLVSFDDYAPTVLNLAGIQKKPSHFSGQAFLGIEQGKERAYVFGHRDRVDEVIDMARSVRDQRYLYIRNYMPHLGYNQQSAWVDQGEVSHEFYRLAKSGTMPPPQWHFAGPTRAREELYDCQDDPLNLKNLADSPGHQEVLRRMRSVHRDWVMKSVDLGFLPETEQWRIAKDAIPMEWAQGDDYDLKNIFDRALLVGSNELAQFQRGLSNDSAAIRYWSAVGLSAAVELDGECRESLTRSLADPSAIVRIESATALARHGHVDTALPVLSKLLQEDDPTVLLHAARAVELLGDNAVSLQAEMQALFKRFEEDPADSAWFIRFESIPPADLNRVHPNDCILNRWCPGFSRSSPSPLFTVAAF